MPPARLLSGPFVGLARFPPRRDFPVRHHSLARPHSPARAIPTTRRIPTRSIRSARRDSRPARFPPGAIPAGTIPPPGTVRRPPTIARQYHSPCKLTR